MFCIVNSVNIIFTYLHDSFIHSGLRHLKILSSGAGIDANWQNGQETKSSIPAVITSISCFLRIKILNCVGDNTFWRIGSLNSPSQASKHETRVVPCAIQAWVPFMIHELQNMWPSSHVEHLDGIHSA